MRPGGFCPGLPHIQNYLPPSSAIFSGNNVQQGTGGRYGLVVDAKDGVIPPIVGHTSLLAVYSDVYGQDWFSLFSNTGGEPGFYSPLCELGMHSDRFPWRYRDGRYLGEKIAACVYIGEVLVGHTTDGMWEGHRSYARRRLCEDYDFKVARHSFSWDQAIRIYNLLEDIKLKTSASEKPVGAPRHFGLNTQAVREIGQFHKELPFDDYRLCVRRGRNSCRSYRYEEIHGGCANAVASVLAAVGLGDLVPDGARFAMELDLGIFKDVVLPVIMRPGAFRNGVPQDDDLIQELQNVPERWGKGNIVTFVDPSYWYLHLLMAEEL